MTTATSGTPSPGRSTPTGRRARPALLIAIAAAVTTCVIGASAVLALAATADFPVRHLDPRFAVGTVRAALGAAACRSGLVLQAHCPQVCRGCAARAAGLR